MDVNWSDFSFINSWKIDESGEKFKNGEPVWAVDQSTGRQYLNESSGVVRFKCFLLCGGTPIFHTIAGVINMATRAFKLITCYHLWKPRASENYDLKGRIKDAMWDAGKIIATPFAFVALEITALIGLFFPYNARKVYASIERGIYDDYFNLAPCFQPNATNHAFGGNIKDQDAF